MIWCSSFTARGSVIAYDFLRGSGDQCEELLGTAQDRGQTFTGLRIG